jgi:hypothetical protein
MALIQGRLALLHYYVSRSGVFDESTALAILAYRKLRGWPRTSSLDSGVIAGLLAGAGTFHVRYPNHGKHVEANLGQQVLALIQGSHVVGIYPTSSGKPSTPTVLGSFRVYRRTPGLQADGMYFSSYFIGGYAVHGYNPAPTYPASHGCLRVPMSDALSIYNWLNFGDGVDVYY